MSRSVRELLRATDTSIILIEMTVSLMYMYVKTYQIIHSSIFAFHHMSIIV